MTEAEFHRARTARPRGEERPHPWGTRLPHPRTACSTSRAGIRSRPAGRPAGASALGRRTTCGNGWEWTSTVFAPFDGFSPLPSYPEYSADFFDGSALRDQGRLAGHVARSVAPRLPELVPAALPLCLRQLSMRVLGLAPHGARWDSAPSGLRWDARLTALAGTQPLRGFAGTRASRRSLGLSPFGASLGLAPHGAR
jgi:hypothetical protein